MLQTMILYYSSCMDGLTYNASSLKFLIKNEMILYMKTTDLESLLQTSFMCAYVHSCACAAGSKFIEIH